MVLGSESLVRGAVNIAKSLGVSSEVIGLTLVAIGTSLPELATSIVAAKKGQSDLSVGNVVGQRYCHCRHSRSSALLYAEFKCLPIFASI